MKMKFYYCRQCGKVLVIEKNSGTPTVCCNEEMKELFPKTNEEFSDKHVPVINVSGSKARVCVGSVPHPATMEHYIEWIILETNMGIQQRWIGPEKEPVADFFLQSEEKVLSAYVYCNIHKLWKGDCCKDNNSTTTSIAKIKCGKDLKKI